MKKRIAILSLVAVLLLSLTACGTEEAAKVTELTKQELLTAPEAQEIALQDAGLTAEQVTFLRTEYDVDDGIPQYEIEFQNGDWEYDYEIHAETGEIRISEKEKADQPAPANLEPTLILPTEPAAEKLTAEQAEEIALNHAGLTRDQVRFDRTEYDVDDGVPEYEIEFRSGDWEYDYKIQAETGEVLLSEKEQEQAAAVLDPSPTQPTQDSSEKLTAKEAEEIALNHAGLTRDQVRFDRTEYDVDDGTPEYEIEFRRDGWEYSYEIHAKTGKVISNEKERDD